MPMSDSEIQVAKARLAVSALLAEIKKALGEPKPQPQGKVRTDDRLSDTRLVG